MDHRQPVAGLRRIRKTLAKGACLVLATAALVGAHAEPVTWYLHNVTYNTGATATGSFTYDAATATFSDINVTLTRPSGTSVLDAVNPSSPGNSAFLSFITNAAGDLTGQPMSVYELATPMTDAGGDIDIVPWPQGFSFAGTCTNATCGTNGGPFHDLTGGSITTGRTWYLENVTYNTGATAAGSFTYDAARGIFGNIDVAVTTSSGTSTLDVVNPSSPGNSGFLSFVANAAGDLTGQPMSVYELATAMTDVGGDIDIVPWPGGFSFAGTCTNATCGTNGGPFHDVTGGRITTGRTWYLDGVTIAGGGAVYGAFNYNADTNMYSNVNITADNGSTAHTYTQLHPLPLLNATTLFLVDVVSADMTGQNGLYLDFTTALTNQGGLTDLKPWPTGGSSQGVCANDVCTLFEIVTDQIDAGIASTALPGPQFVNATGASVAENQTDAIDVQAVDIGDSEGNGLTFAISGGADAALFAIDADFGLVTFLSAPNTAAPSDANGDNTYAIEVTVTNTAGRSSVQAISITVFAVANISSLQTALDFGTVAPSDLPQLLEFAFSSDGNASLEVSSIEISGPSASSFDAPDVSACIGTLPAQTSCAIPVEFDPAVDPASGSKTATLTVFSNDPDQPGFEVSLTAQISVPDTDGDGFTDDIDNCRLIANTDQRDTDGDGFGNVCDPDLNNDNIVNASDLGLLRLVFFSADPNADFNGDGVVNVVDLGIMRVFFFQPPGPAGNTGP